ncbi:MAG: mannosyltransferase [Actinomycetota bacterium]|nr:mannosyltransferase [Actinomycetota bacterium]
MTVEDLRVHPLGPDSDRSDRPVSSPASRRRRWAAAVAIGLAVALGVVARFFTVSHLWLDEALTVNIARLPLGDMFRALRHDGSPPLFYLLLHGWMDMAGTGDVAARALPGLLAVASLPLMGLAGRRLVGDGAMTLTGTLTGTLSGPPSARWVPWAGVLLLASSPFAIHYATEVRMYSLVVLLVLAGFLALDTVRRRPSWPAAVGLGLCTGLLLLTHYWAFFLVAAVAGLLALRWADAGVRRALLAMAVGSLLFVPWLPSFLEQMRTTGTPWGTPPKPRTVFDIVLQFGAGLPDTALPLGLLLYALLALGLFGFVAGTGRTEPGIVTLDLRGRPPGRMLAAVAGFTMAMAVVVGEVTRSAFAIRYAAVVFPLVLLLAALGSATLAGTWMGPVVLGLAVALGFATAIPNAAGDRTTAGRVAAALRAEARPGDVVAYCPDQLGPSVSRLLEHTSGLRQLTFPRATPPQLVDWVDYLATNQADPAPFAHMLVDLAGPDATVWVVWAPNYRTFGTRCQGLLTDLRAIRPDERRVVKVSTNTSERPGLVQYRPN